MDSAGSQAGRSGDLEWLECHTCGLRKALGCGFLLGGACQPLLAACSALGSKWDQRDEHCVLFTATSHSLSSWQLWGEREQVALMSKLRPGEVK